MFQQYQAMYSQNMAMQQQLLAANGGNSNSSTPTSNTAQAQFPQMGGFPMMQPMGMPGLGATGDQTNQMQSPFMQMPGMMPTMPMMFPNP